MLKIESKGHGAQIEATGSAMDLAVEAVSLITGIYNQLKESEPVAAKVFQGVIMKCTQEGGLAWERPESMVGISLDKGAWEKYGGKRESAGPGYEGRL